MTSGVKREGVRHGERIVKLHRAGLVFERHSCRGWMRSINRGAYTEATLAKGCLSVSYCQKWCLTIDSSGGLIDVGHFDSIVEFHSNDHLGQITEST